MLSARCTLQFTGDFVYFYFSTSLIFKVLSTKYFYHWCYPLSYNTPLKTPYKLTPPTSRASRNQQLTSPSPPSKSSTTKIPKESTQQCDSALPQPKSASKEGIEPISVAWEQGLDTSAGSEYSNRRDESHRYRFYSLFGSVSPLAAIGVILSTFCFNSS